MALRTGPSCSPPLDPHFLVWKGSFSAAHPVLAWAPKMGEKREETESGQQDRAANIGEVEGRWSLSERGVGTRVAEGASKVAVPVAGSPGARLNYCTQLRSPRASWMQAGGHGPGHVPNTHRAPFEEVAAVSPDPTPSLAVAPPAPSSNTLLSTGLGTLKHSLQR